MSTVTGSYANQKKKKRLEKKKSRRYKTGNGETNFLGAIRFTKIFDINFDKNKFIFFVLLLVMNGFYKYTQNKKKTNVFVLSNIDFKRPKLL